MAHTFNLTFGRQADLCELKLASLVYRSSSRTARTKQRNLITKQNTIKKKKKKKRMLRCIFPQPLFKLISLGMGLCDFQDNLDYIQRPCLQKIKSKL